MALVLQINRDLDMIERMERDLQTKCTAAFVSAGVDSLIYGIFSVDDLEAKQESAFGSKVAVGVGYAGAEKLIFTGNPKSSPSPQGGGAAVMVDYVFSVILACPTGPCCDERYNATKLLTALRFGIHGTVIDNDPVQRQWGFERESPNVQASTPTMLYYTQVWHVALIQTPKPT